MNISKPGRNGSNKPLKPPLVKKELKLGFAEEKENQLEDEV